MVWRGRDQITASLRNKGADISAFFYACEKLLHNDGLTAELA
ncbi:hypothetical protein ESA_01303 [Cronobacter sakazakii ATCC BAA-894]|uniref:Uncharacterized protein n=1 Tax=Cronobacter sakazakii (strain ATCC BAA-894) TaxID=290339 RepID=A7MJH4_CROS8|nr:hypothetical protein ESA_01303 [Cronobacter sakazakii ATCC BAA-894]